jgi:hypothetical protein
MRIPWKYVGLAGVAGVAATGVAVARRRRGRREDIGPDELRERLHERLAEVRDGAQSSSAATSASSSATTSPPSRTAERES